MAEIYFTGKKLTKKQRDKQEAESKSLTDFKLQFTWGRITKTSVDLRQGVAGLKKYGLKPETFIKTPEYLYIAQDMYKKYPEYKESQIFKNAVKVAKEFGVMFKGSVYMPLLENVEDSTVVAKIKDVNCDSK
jgi:hypothetical protein